MADIFDRQTRSRVMAAIRGRDTKPEMIVRRFLHARGMRFRLHRRDLPGRPDLVFPKYRVAVFVHGCFWHQHAACRYAVMPKSNRPFWVKKLRGNQQRDLRNAAKLRRAGWRVLTVWECRVHQQALEALVRKIEVSLGRPHSRMPR